MSVRNYLDKLKQYAKFSREEWLHLIIVILGLTVIYVWPSTGSIIYLEQIPKALLFITIILFVHHLGQRMFALALGFRAEHRVWWYGILIGLMLVILTNGKIKFLAATAMTVYLLPVHRLGAFRYGPGLTTIAKIAMAGPILNIFFSALVKSFEWAGILSTSIGNELFVLNIAFAAWNLLPIPPLDGSKVFYYSRLTYAFLFGSIGSYVFMIYFLNIYSYIYAILIGCLVWLIYYIFLERHLVKI